MPLCIYGLKESLTQFYHNDNFNTTCREPQKKIRTGESTDEGTKIE